MLLWIGMLTYVGGSMSKTLYMAIQNFRNGAAVPAYRRFRDRGRLAPGGTLDLGCRHLLYEVT